jgi:nucleoside-diphosphate-sugar epimerase
MFVGETENYKIISAVNARMGSIALVHIEDICNAHIFLMENAKAEGRYICTTQSCTLSNLVALVSKEYSSPNTQR